MTLSTPRPSPDAPLADLERFFDALMEPTPAVQWLERAGEAAKRMNEEAEEDRL